MRKGLLAMLVAGCLAALPATADPGNGKGHAYGRNNTNTFSTTEIGGTTVRTHTVTNPAGVHSRTLVKSKTKVHKHARNAKVTRVRKTSRSTTVSF